MFNSVTIIPTGDELRDGIVLDTDSPIIMQTLLSINGCAEIKRIAPVLDVEQTIEETVKEHAKKSDLVVLIGGSGGGHRYCKTLGKDYTHSSLEVVLEEKYSNEIYGKNGHMWCKLIIGTLGKSLVINLPGPFEETSVAIKAFKREYLKDENNYKAINKAMINAVKSKYGK